MRFDLRGLRGLSLLVLCLAGLSVSAATITVTNTNDTGPGSLRQALLDAKNPGDRIEFAIGSGVQTIRPMTPLGRLAAVSFWTAGRSLVTARRR
ncbi:MAG TPA: hypothetical protein VF846_20550 [Thermoanaerobaculia bacterium]|jgi:hypothetical protein